MNQRRLNNKVYHSMEDTEGSKHNFLKYLTVWGELDRTKYLDTVYLNECDRII